jgi:probable phosphoglycerate mutase
MLTIILVRHGETEWNKIHRLQGGDSDTPLNETGRQQAARLSGRLKDERLDAIYSSPLQRAVDTARTIARHHQLEVVTSPALKEIRVGQLEGADSTTMKIRWDQLLCQDNNGEASRYGVELIGDVQARAWGVVKEIAAKHKEGTVVIVTHYLVIMALVCAVLDLPLERIVHLKLDPGTITTFIITDEGNTRLALFNDSCHNACG